MGDAKRKREAADVRVPAAPPAGQQFDFRAMPTRISARHANERPEDEDSSGWILYEKDPLTGAEEILAFKREWTEIYKHGVVLVKLLDGRSYGQAVADPSIKALQTIFDGSPVHGAGADARAAADRGITPMPAAAPETPETTVGQRAAVEPFTIAHLTTAGPNHWKDAPPDPSAFRCPHCGAWRPGYGFNGQHAQMPGMGLVDYVTMYCGECKVVLQIQILALDPAGTGGRGFRTH